MLGIARCHDAAGFGGSLGARHIDAAISSLKKQLLAIDGLYVVHITGPKEYEATCAELALTDEEASRWTVMPYQDRMAETLRAADCTISRAGATSLAEISALGVACFARAVSLCGRRPPNHQRARVR